MIDGFKKTKSQKPFSFAQLTACHFQFALMPLLYDILNYIC